MKTLKADQTIPEDFDYNVYLRYNPDLKSNGIDSEQSATIHYVLFGRKEQRVYKEEKILDCPIDTDFDSEFYISEYPDVRTYYKNAINIPETEKLFHHYIHYGKQEGRFKNKIEQEKSLVDTEHQTVEYIKSEFLICPQNKLECICLLTTEKEINNKQYSRFISRLLEKTKKSNITKDIDFKIILNQKEQSKINTSALRQIFSSVEIINLSLSKKEDIYETRATEKIIKSLPPYGLKSGPNTCFFKTIPLCSQYNTTLFLETDCFLGNDWVNRLSSYVKYANGFLVSGATYDGTVFTKSGSPMMNHINGGTALYATGHPALQNLIEMLSVFLIKQIANNMPGLAYDYALKLLIDHNLNNNYNNEEEYLIWQFINRNYLPSKLIINYSTAIDSKIDNQEIQKKHNYAILHKKE